VSSSPGLQCGIVHLFCDASGEPAHIAAVLISNSSCLWTHANVPDELIAHFRRRNDNQIMGLELLSIALGINTFGDFLRKKRVFIYSDNTGSEVILCSRAFRVVLVAFVGSDQERHSEEDGPCAACPYDVDRHHDVRDGRLRETRCVGNEYCRLAVKTDGEESNVYGGDRCMRNAPVHIEGILPA
jgi:hypothetical protein